MHPRKFEIQDDYIRRRGTDRRKSRGPIGSKVDGVSLAFKDVFQGFVQRPVVFNNQQSLRIHRRHLKMFEYVLWLQDTKREFGSESRSLGGERVRLTQPLQTHYICLTFKFAGSDIPSPD